MIAAWPTPSPDAPLRILVSGCLAGWRVGFDGSTYGRHDAIQELLAYPAVQGLVYCPEDCAFGTPRQLCDIHGGDGHDVLAGRARVLMEDGTDVTAPMIDAAFGMLDACRQHEARMALLMDISAACGSQVIYDGRRPGALYRAGAGVCAALLIEQDIPVVSQRDARTLALIWRKIDATRSEPSQLLIDHHESEWYASYFAPV